MQIVEKGRFGFARDTRMEGGQFSLAGEPYLLTLTSGLDGTCPGGTLKFFGGEGCGLEGYTKDCKSREIKI